MYPALPGYLLSLAPVKSGQIQSKTPKSGQHFRHATPFSPQEPAAALDRSASRLTKSRTPVLVS